ncbi:MAG TPA: glycosyltransferase family 25 protein, partial [Acidimicrobiia bacterium]|nr:glycosyltransferase family 25 protein [Acidimicrobiia bacterium]
MTTSDRTLVDGPRAAAATIPLYCVNLPSSPDRKARMTRRFAELGLLDRVRFVPAVERISPQVDQHLARAGIEWAPSRRRAEIACLLSHLKALAMFVEDTSAASAIVFEDDVLLHRDWHEQLAGVLDNLEEGVPLCSLGYEVVSWEGFDWA